MPAIKPSLSLVLGQQYGPLTQSYARRVAQAGGRIDNAERALRMLDRALYGEYSNGAGGVGSVASLAHSFLSLWMPVSDFAGITVPVIGPTLTNISYVTGDWNRRTGMQGGSGKALNAGIQYGQASNNIFSMGIYNSTSINYSLQQLSGGRTAANDWGLDLGANGGASQVRFRPGNTTITTAISTGASGLMVVSRLAASGDDAAKLFEPNGTIRSINSTAIATASTLNLYYGALNAGGSVNLHHQNRYSVGYISVGTAIDTPQVAILRNALDALDIARADL